MYSAFIASTLQASLEVYTFIHHKCDISCYDEVSQGAGGDISIGFDLKAEAIYVDALKSFGQIHSEESGVMGEGEFTIVLDPIDGSDNLKSHFPYYGSSIALQVDNETVVGIVCNFATAECFVREGDNLYIYNLLSKCSAPIVPNSYAKVGIFEKALLHADKVELLRQKKLKFRAPGAVAISIASAYYVKYVLFLGTIRPYDVEAALYIAKDLNVYVDDTIIIIAQSSEVFAQLKAIFL